MGISYYIKTPQNGGSDSNDGLSWNTAFATFGHAIKTAASGDEINVAAGTYTENITSSKRLSFYGSYPAKGGNVLDFKNNITIIEGRYSGFVVTLNADTVISGLTIAHGKKRMTTVQAEESMSKIAA